MDQITAHRLAAGWLTKSRYFGFCAAMILEVMDQADLAFADYEGENHYLVATLRRLRKLKYDPIMLDEACLDATSKPSESGLILKFFDDIHNVTTMGFPIGHDYYIDYLRTILRRAQSDRLLYIESFYRLSDIKEKYKAKLDKNTALAFRTAWVGGYHELAYDILRGSIGDEAVDKLISRITQ